MGRSRRKRGGLLRSRGKRKKDLRNNKSRRPGRQWSRVKSGRRKVDVIFKKFENKEKLGAGASRGENGEMKRGKKGTIIRRSSVGAHFKSKVLEFFERVRIDNRGGRVPDI